MRDVMAGNEGRDVGENMEKMRKGQFGKEKVQERYVHNFIKHLPEFSSLLLSILPVNIDKFQKVLFYSLSWYYEAWEACPSILLEISLGWETLMVQILPSPSGHHTW